MLQSLDDVDWHAAAAVPALLRELTSPDEETWGPALEQLWDDIYHQGDLYAITPLVVPYFVALLDHQEVGCRASLLGMLGCLARNRFHADEIALAAAESTPLAQHIREQQALSRATRAAVAAGLPQILRQLDDPDPAVRIEAAFPLGAFAEQAVAIAPALWRAAEADPVPAVRASALVSLGDLLAPEVTTLERFGQILASDAPDLVKLGAAMGLSRLAGASMPPEAVGWLCEAVLHPAAFAPLLNESSWGTETELGSYFEPLGPELTAHASSLLLAGLETLPPDSARPVQYAILDLHFALRQEPLDAAGLTDAQRRLLAALLAMDRLWAADIDLGRTLSQFYGLPGTRDGVLRCLMEAPAAAPRQT